MAEPLLTAEEERELAERIAAGDVDARRRMIEANMRLVISIAGDYRRRGMEFEDVVGEGTIGLIKAVDRYRAAVGTRFSTYAAYWIRQAIGEAIANRAATIRVPVHMTRILLRWRSAERAIWRETGRAPTFDEIAERLELSDKHKALVFHAIETGRISSWSYSVVAESRFLPETPVDDDDEQMVFLGRLDRLDRRERAVVTRRFGCAGEPESVTRIAASMRVSRKRVRNLLDRALENFAPAPTRRHRDIDAILLV